GNSEDDTLELIRSIDSPKIRLIETVWDDSLRQGGKVLALETDKAFKAIHQDYDWAFYIQGDEVIHEKYLDTILKAMRDYQDQPQVEGLLFKYLHFFGSYDYVGDSRNWYRREIRVVRNDKAIFSYRDAQGFRKEPNQKLRVKLIDAEVYHYGWVKDPRTQQEKQKRFHKLWHDDSYIEKNEYLNADSFDYGRIDSLKLFEGKHPQVMQDRIARINWRFDHDISRKNYSYKNGLLMQIERWTGWRIGEYRNYKII
ncbi:MAG: glycosyltransferase family 2 protein, partial [Bacteroidota bacterium]